MTINGTDLIGAAIHAKTIRQEAHTAYWREDDDRGEHHITQADDALHKLADLFGYRLVPREDTE